ncbi:MAG TPA: thioredoxin domain-containing protein [Solirubrobacteraceae bacterium]|nr:thioredoxin domain-containing protein [Solirubrobacteraceae bacterium]
MIAWPGFAGFGVLTGALRAPPLALAGGSLIFVIFVVVLLFAVVFGYYTRRGSGISQTPYRRADGPPESPSELAHDTTQDIRNWERGTGEGHGRHRPVTVREPAEPEIAQALREWRHGTSSVAHLDPPVSASDHVYAHGPGSTVAIYVDLASAPCRSAWQLLIRLAEQRPIRIAVRHLPLADVHELSLPAAEALEAAGAQGEFFALLDRLARTGLSDKANLVATASRLVADPERLRLEVSNGRHRARVVEHIHQATASGAHAIPALYINAAPYDGLLDVDTLTSALR